MYFVILYSYVLHFDSHLLKHQQVSLFCSIMRDNLTGQSISNGIYLMFTFVDFQLDHG